MYLYLKTVIKMKKAICNIADEHVLANLYVRMKPNIKERKKNIY